MSASREETLFESALALPEADRSAYLAQACGGDEGLRRAVEGLLAAHGSGDARMDGAAASVDAMGRMGMLLATGTSSPGRYEPGEQVGRYRLLEQIGEGGCGVVYMAEQREPVRRRVALKVLKPGMDSKAVVGRFEAERQALALMDHPNIARVYDAGTTDRGHPYFVMELVRGMPITEFCDSENLDTTQRLELFILVCGAVQHAHQKGIIHRDLKPSNVLVSILDGQPVPKVIDFGIAKATQGPLTDQTVFTAFTQFVGTPAYMSPEQAGFGVIDVDTRADIYSLGVLLYELLTGAPPFDAEDLLRLGFDAMRQRLREEQPERPSRRLSTLAGQQLETRAKARATAPPRLIKLVRGDLDWIVMKCLEKDRNRRYSTANGLASDLRRHLSMEPVTARPPSRWDAAIRTFRRHRLVVFSVGAVMLALALGVVAALSQARRAESARAEAARALELARRESLRGGELFRMGDTWRSILYGCAKQVEHRWFSNMVVRAEIKYLDTTEDPLAKLLWKVYFSFMRSWARDRTTAERHMQEAMEGIESTFGSESRDACYARMWLTDMMSAFGKVQLAEAQLRTNLALARRLDPPDWRSIASAEKNLGIIEQQRTNYAGMLQHYQRSMEALKHGFPHKSYGISYYRVVMATHLFYARQTNECLQVLRERLEEEKQFDERLDGLEEYMTRTVLLQHLLKMGRVDEAEAVIDDGIQRYATGTPRVGSDFLFIERAEVSLRKGREEAALEDALHARRTVPDSVGNWRLSTLLLLKAGRRAEYEQQCVEGVERFLFSTTRVPRETVLGGIALMSTNAFALEVASTMARGMQAENDSAILASIVARLRDRQGDYAGAVSAARQVTEKQLDQVAKEPGASEDRLGWELGTRFSEAMATWRLGRKDEAREILARARVRWDAVTTQTNRYWLRDCLEGEILRREAMELIDPAPGERPSGE